MSNNINSVDITALTVFKMELQRILAMKLNIHPEIIGYMKSRINDIENNDE